MTYKAETFYGYGGQEKYVVNNKQGRQIAECYSKAMAERVAKGLNLELEERNRLKNFRI